MMTVCDMVIAVTAGEDEPDALVYARDKGKPIMYIDANTPEVRQQECRDSYFTAPAEYL